MNSLLQEGILSTRNVAHAAILNRHGIAKVRSPNFELNLEEWSSLESAFDSSAVSRGQTRILCMLKQLKGME
ncbi:hypothetical protein SeMB42_g05489 [Synchytrium endobioticum]|uniref:Uncharacterized protein n=1 Tax=Synchytrium endobioticum TaxID=286115 RepID=A0A507CRF1_9FUNG|nr:hypothetical protein SeMB42_g05489 [Synchytrium endobioticum]